MSRSGNAASLQEQMAKLHQNMSFRDKRRAQQQEMRQGGADDPYEDRASKRVAGRGGAAVGGGKDASSAARAAVASATALDGPNLMRCDACSVSFAVESQMMQHLAGPSHKKTVERAAAEERRLVQLGNNRWAAENAAASASWQQNTRYTPAARQPITIAPAHEFGSESGGQSAPLPITATKATAGISATLSGSAPGGGGRLAGPPPARPRKLTPEEAERAAVAERARIAHAERVAAAQQTFGPPSIGGWVPPTVLSAKLGSVAKDTEESSSDRDENGGALSLPAVEAIKQEAFVKQESPVKEENGNTLPECSDDSSHSGSSDTDTSCEDGGVPRQRPISFF